MSKKKQVVQDVPVDKVDEFFRNNYRKVISVLGLLILVFIVGYGVTSFMRSSSATKFETVGRMEAAGMFDPATIERYASLADYVSSEKDYIHMVAAARYMDIDQTDSAISEASKVGGVYTEYSKSLLYDLQTLKGETPTAASGGMFASAWYYRQALAAEGEERTQIVAGFRENYPESRLLAQLDRWGIK